LAGEEGWEFLPFLAKRRQATPGGTKNQQKTVVNQEVIKNK
jgi:hypothetical protein